MCPGYLPKDDGLDPGQHEGVIRMTDDIIIHGKDDVEHDSRLH